jgi:hypothetical protein
LRQKLFRGPGCGIKEQLTFSLVIQLACGQIGPKPDGLHFALGQKTASKKQCPFLAKD